MDTKLVTWSTKVESWQTTYQAEVESFLFRFDDWMQSNPNMNLSLAIKQ